MSATETTSVGSAVVVGAAGDCTTSAFGFIAGVGVLGGGSVGATSVSV